ncbi:MAG: IclR family transcriptional regulator C-terminal domain-containing protein [Azospirillaceae bacterium]
MPMNDIDGALATTSQGTEAPTGVLQRGLLVLDFLRNASRPLPLGEIADGIGLDTSTVLRALKVLVESGYALRIDPAKTYIVGPNLVMPFGFQHPLIALRLDCHGYLVDLMAETSMTATLFVLIGRHRITLDLVLGRDRITRTYGAEVASPIHTSTSGKLLLMATPREQWSELLGDEPYRRFTDTTITDRASLEVDIRKSIERGYMRSGDETAHGLFGITAPLRGPQDRIIAGINLYCHSRWVTEEKERQAADALLRACHMVELTSAALPALTSYLS